MREQLFPHDIFNLLIEHIKLSILLDSDFNLKSSLDPVRLLYSAEIQLSDWSWFLFAFSTVFHSIVNHFKVIRFLGLK